MKSTLDNSVVPTPSGSVNAHAIAFLTCAPFVFHHFSTKLATRRGATVDVTLQKKKKKGTFRIDSIYEDGNMALLSIPERTGTFEEAISAFGATISAFQ